MKKYRKSLFIFRRDLRLDDNTGLIKALEESQEVFPVFFLDKRLLEDNKYKSDNAIQFMSESLKDLHEDLLRKGSRLNIIHGIPEETLGGIITDYEIESVYFNRDYTPFSKKRDVGIRKICIKKKINVSDYPDALLNEPENITKKNGDPYTIFTAFKNVSVFHEVRKVRINKFSNYSKVIMGSDNILSLNNFPNNINLYTNGGRTKGLEKIEKIIECVDYESERNFPSLDGTTGLSAHNKFGTVSIREVYWAIVEAFGTRHPLINELYWRDFFTHISFQFPKVFEGAFYKKFDNIVWSEDFDVFELWKKGMTGFPIVDAGMRQLNFTGYMHNRVRMIAASFLIKDLHINWQWGERYFAQKLVDYDPCVNNGNWQWVASTGCDAAPYFRIFNPWLQQKKYDKDCSYIKKWIPELEQYSPRQIHDLEFGNGIGSYPKAIVDHKKMSFITKQMYSSV